MEQTEFQKLQQEYGKLAQIFGDLKYRAARVLEDADVIEKQMKEINIKAGELAAQEQKAKPVEGEVVQ